MVASTVCHDAADELPHNPRPSCFSYKTYKQPPPA